MLIEVAPNAGSVRSQGLISKALVGTLSNASRPALRSCPDQLNLRATPCIIYGTMAMLELYGGTHDFQQTRQDRGLACARIRCVSGRHRSRSRNRVLGTVRSAAIRARPKFGQSDRPRDVHSNLRHRSRHAGRDQLQRPPRAGIGARDTPLIQAPDIAPPLRA